MKILIVNFEYPPLGGGGGVATQDIAELLAQRHEVYVLTTHFGNLHKKEVKERVNIIRVPVLGRKSLPTASFLSLITFVPGALWQGARLLRKESFDIINAQFVVPSGVPAAILARMFGVPLVVSLVGGDLYDPTKGMSPHRHWWLRALVKWITEAAVICTAISSDTRRRAIDLFGITREIVVTHLGIKKTKLETINRERLGWSSDKYYLITVGRLIPRKGYEVMLRALSKTRAGVLVIIGGGPLEKKLRSTADKLGIADRVEIMGFVEEERKQQMLANADLYVSASEHEGFGIVYLEAMHWGLPIVSTDNGGQMDFLNEGNSIVVGAGDADGLAQAIEKIGANEELRNTMSENSSNDVKRFYLEETVRNFENVLLKAIGQENESRN